MAQKLDGEGRPYITLASFLKLEGLVETGGIAKEVVREGLAKVNGHDESRPGRKLHAGDRVTFDRRTFVVDLERTDS